MLSLQRQREIYINGLAGCVPLTPLSFAGLEHRARQILSPSAFAYLAGGAGSETTIDSNRQALDKIKIHPHMLGGVQEASMLLTWREHTLPAPFMLAPIGVLELAHREGDLAVARAAKATHVPMIISSQASFPMEEISTQLDSNPRLFQLYYSKSKELSQSFVQRAETIGCTALVVTLDTTMLGWRVRDLDLGYSPFILGKGIAQYYSDPVFNQLPDPVDANSIKPPLTISLIKSLISLNNRMPGGFLSNLQSKRAMKSVRKFLSVFNNPGMNWDDIALIRSWTKMPIYLKGIIRPDDALKAADAGVDGIIISNHGGRQIDGSVSTVETLPSIVNAINDKLDIWIDSGIRTGSDVFKCVALGAKGVLIGRPYAYALACGGQQGVVDCISNIMAELELIMALSGCKTIADINADLISHPWNVK